MILIFLLFIARKAYLLNVFFEPAILQSGRFESFEKSLGSLTDHVVSAKHFSALDSRQYGSKVSIGLSLFAYAHLTCLSARFQSFQTEPIHAFCNFELS